MHMNTQIVILSTVLATLAACTNSKTATEADFGNSKASLIRAQAADPARSSNPSTEPVTGVDPDYANNVVGAMRENVSKPEQVRQPLEIRVDGSN
jgi:hypothetical protein